MCECAFCGSGLLGQGHRRKQGKHAKQCDTSLGFHGFYLTSWGSHRSTRMTQSRSASSAFVRDKELQKNSEYSSRLGEPEPAFVTWFVVALLTIALRTVADEAPGLNCL